MLMPLHNALGAMYWPQSVQDELARLSGRKFIPEDELLVAGLDGRPLSEYSDTIGRGASNALGISVYLSLNTLWDERQEAELEPKESYIDDSPVTVLAATFESDILPFPVSAIHFHGTTRANLFFKKTKIIRAEPNAKRRWCKWRCRDSIRTMHEKFFNSNVEIGE